VLGKETGRVKVEGRAFVSDLKLFRIDGGRATELPGRGFAVELELQRLIEANLETLFGVRRVASAHRFTGWRDGEIDCLGLDENGSPVIFEFKRANDQNVINQGLYYLDWLLEHQGDFQLLVERALGREAAAEIDWRNPRLVCVAGAFNRFDEHAVEQINRSIELVRYRDFEGELLALELVKARAGSPRPGGEARASSGRKPALSGSVREVKTVTQLLDQAPGTLKDLYAEFEAFAEALGDDVTKEARKHYVAFRRLRNFACVEVKGTAHALLVYLKVDPTTVSLEEGFSRDVRSIGHYGTGGLELRIRNREDLKKSQELIRQSYDSSRG
jgi:predicted transport protein